MAPGCAALQALHTPADQSPPSQPPQHDILNKLTSGSQTFNGVEDVIKTVRQLHSIEDPVVTPHKSKYAARVILTDVLQQLRGLASSADFSDAERQWLKEQIGRLEYLTGVNHIESEETSAGEKMLAKAMLKFKENAEKYPFDVIDGYNHLGIVWSNRSQHDVACTYLQMGQKAFLRFKKLRAEAMKCLSEAERKAVEEEDKKMQQEVESENSSGASGQEVTASTDATVTSSAASSSSTSFSLSSLSIPPTTPGYSFLDPSLWHSLEVTHTLTLFFLAQVFGHQKKRDLSAIYCHLCLNRQLKQRRDFNRQEWVTNAIGLSFYYSGRRLFKQAHHCLLAAQHFVDEKDMPKKMNTAEADSTKDEQLAADLCRAWGAFYLKWLQRSRDAYIESEYYMQVDAEEKKSKEDDAQAIKDAQLAEEARMKGRTGNSSAAPSTPSSKSVDDDGGDGPSDPSTMLSSLPAEDLASLRRLQRLDREREKEYQNRVEEEADEEEDELFGSLPVATSGTATPQRNESKNHDESTPVSDRTLPKSLSKEESDAVREELKKSGEDSVTDNNGENADTAASETSSSDSASSDSSSSPSSTASSSSSSSRNNSILIEFSSLHLPPSPSCALARTFPAARSLFKLSFDWFTRASLFYVLDGWVSDHIPIQQDISLAYKLLAVFDPDLSRQCKMHKRRIDLLAPIASKLSVAAYQEFYQQITDEVASCYAEMMELKSFIYHMKVKVLGAKFSEKQRKSAQSKINELCLKAIQFYQAWLASWSKDGSMEVKELDPYYHRWYLMAMFKVARCYSKIYHEDPTVLNQFTKKAYEQYKAVVNKAESWHAESAMGEELELCRQMVQLLPLKMDKTVAHGSFRP